MNTKYNKGFAMIIPLLIALALTGAAALFVYQNNKKTTETPNNISKTRDIAPLGNHTTTAKSVGEIKQVEQMGQNIETVSQNTAGKIKNDGITQINFINSSITKETGIINGKPNDLAEAVFNFSITPLKGDIYFYDMDSCRKGAPHNGICVLWQKSNVQDQNDPALWMIHPQDYSEISRARITSSNCPAVNGAFKLPKGKTCFFMVRSQFDPGSKKLSTDKYYAFIQSIDSTVESDIKLGGLVDYYDYFKDSMKMRTNSITLNAADFSDCDLALSNYIFNWIIPLFNLQGALNSAEQQLFVKGTNIPENLYSDNFVVSMGANPPDDRIFKALSLPKQISKSGAKSGIDKAIQYLLTQYSFVHHSDSDGTSVGSYAIRGIVGEYGIICQNIWSSNSITSENSDTFSCSCVRKYP